VADYRLTFKQRYWTNEAKLAYLLMLPAIAFLAFFMFYPIIYVFAMSLFKTNKIGHIQEFVFFENFINTFKDVEFWKITGRSGIWTVMGVATKTIFGMIIALILNYKYRGRKIARMLFIAPWASSVPISAILWTWVYDQEFGLLSHTLIKIGLLEESPAWLGRPLLAFGSALWVDVWIGIPFMALIFLAGMQAISEDLYESAYIDGVNHFQKFTYITLPGIAHIIIVATLLSALWTFNDFNTIYILTRGGPAGTTDILITGVYKNAFEWLKFSKASVMAVVTFVILMTVSIMYARLYFKGENE
jgi:multiple sugar transport system permease protein